ncbi:hypothetical protein HW115_05130 [Verrucomicrobiaceae bacterium N1E253]|uniref:DUF3987 domain-containing protein n=1 Tax=Oceaniferula marina TaxID=2748318 RepID=A0A851GGM0_9BACT|nr:hypothetical protein [Oceaniferula marina]NWK54981.1 hypothetical protein [Oceaniferula marina]
MNPDEQDQLDTFLNTFNAHALGEGDLNAGINTLAAMLCTLANIARPGSAIISPDAKCSPVGTSLLVTGALSSSIITNDVLTELRLRQNNIVSQLKHAKAIQTKEDEANRPKQVTFLKRKKTNQAESSLHAALNHSQGAMNSATGNWAMAANSPPNPDFDTLTQDAKIVVSASNARELKTQVQGSHLGKPLVLLGLNHSSCYDRMSELCSALQHGLLPDTEHGKTVKGNLIITDPDDMLSDLIKNTTHNTAYLNHCVWLVDGNAGPEPHNHVHDISWIGNPTNRFKEALSRGFGQRLNHESQYPVLHELDMIGAQHRWIEFLKGVEDSLPGINGHARNLLASLVFGVLELTSCLRVADAGNPMEGIEVFARLLVQRMANARSLMTYSKQQARNDRLKQSILHKLDRGPHSVRDLTRRFNRLSTAQCRELLFELEDGDYVQNNTNGEWSLTGRLATSIHTQTIEV